MNQKNHSTKTVKPLEAVTGNKTYVLPKDLQNDVDPDGMYPSVLVFINSRKIFLHVGIPIEIPQDAFSVLKDAGIIKESYQITPEFDPLYVH